MKFYGLSIDPSVLVALIGAASSIFLAIKGKSQVTRKKKEREDGQ